MTYIWELPDWPDFKYQFADKDDITSKFISEVARISGFMVASPENLKVETLLDAMIIEAIKTSEIEGEYLSRQDVASSIRNNLGLVRENLPVKDKKAKGVGELMVDARRTFAEPLTQEKLFAWHKMLFTGNTNINAGAWRTGNEPMQVVSGSIGKEKVHFEAPPSGRVPLEMERFVTWFNDTAPGGKSEIKKAPLRSAIAHLYFETIHPFEDGNGRIGRVLAEKVLSQTMGQPVLLSLSRTIDADRKGYYAALEKAQKSSSITSWINYFVQVIISAQQETRAVLDFTLMKTHFLDKFKNAFNTRQLKVVKKMLDAGPAGFEGGMTAAKYMGITKTSKATATRDLQQMVEMRALIPTGGGRSVRYQLNTDIQNQILSLN